MIEAVRYHDICAGHRVYGHESKCAHLHGHNYRVHFYCRAEMDENGLDHLGRVVDFSVIKEKLCMWIENNYDHKFLVFEKDPIAPILKEQDPEGVVIVPYNPTAENIAMHLCDVIAPQEMAETGIIVTKVIIEETAKCSVHYSL